MPNATMGGLGPMIRDSWVAIPRGSADLAVAAGPCGARARGGHAGRLGWAFRMGAAPMEPGPNPLKPPSRISGALNQAPCGR